jgi:hypothetical protein
MRPALLRLFLVLVSSSTLPALARAQADYRNLSSGRPITIEDAQPVEYRAIEFEFGLLRFAREHRGEWLFSLEPEFKLGLFKNTQVGYATHLVAQREPANTVFAASDSVFHLLYNLNQETRRLPAISIRPELAIRTGGLGARHEHGGLKLLVSKTVRANRFHFNGGCTFGDTESSGRGGELVSRCIVGAAYERTLPLRFMVLLVDVTARKPIDGGKTQVLFEAGARIQLNPAWVLDAGISTGQLRPSVGPDVAFTIGLTRAFSFRWLQTRRAPPAHATLPARPYHLTGSDTP